MTLSRKFGIAISVVLILFMTVFAVIYSLYKTAFMDQDLKNRNHLMRQTVIRILDMTDAALTDKTKLSMSLIQKEAQLLGEARTGRAHYVNGASLPQLWFGTELQSGNTEFVERLKKEIGGDVSLFAKQGNQFVRVATTIVKDGK